jgi:hypothetical protein
MLTLAIDPGLRYTGWALAKGKDFIQCGSAEGGDPPLDSRCARISTALKWWLDPHPGQVQLVVEKPQVYVQRHSKGDPNDLVDLGILLGHIIATLQPAKVKFALPRQWKGTVPKAKRLSDYIIHKRLTRKMSHQEAAVYDAGLKTCIPSQRHNIADAVGILFWHLNRSTSQPAQQPAPPAETSCSK